MLRIASAQRAEGRVGPWKEAGVVAFDFRMMEVVVGGAVAEGHQVGGAPGEVVACVAFGGFPFAKHDPDVKRDDVCADEQWADQHDGARQNKLDRVHVIPGDRPGRHDAVVHRVNLFEKPSALVEAAVHPVEQEVVEQDEEHQLNDDDPPGGQRPGVHIR